jgi:hypothetical protein
MKPVLLQETKGYSWEQLPAERTMRDILNRLGYRLKRIRKAKRLKKAKDNDAIFANVQAGTEEFHSWRWRRPWGECNSWWARFAIELALQRWIAIFTPV